MKIKLIIISIIVIIPIVTAIAGGNKSQFFIENKGQWPSTVKFLGKVGGSDVWITDSGAVYNFFQIIRDSNYSPMSYDRHRNPDDNSRIRGHVIKMEFMNQGGQSLVEGKGKGASFMQEYSKNPDSLKKMFQPGYEGIDKQEGYYNYFIGNDSTKWASNVPLFKEVKVKSIYNGIDVRYYYEGNNIRYDYIVQPGADVSQIKVKYKGQDSLYVNAQGELIFKTSLGEIKHAQLKGYQDKEHIQSIIKMDDKDTVGTDPKVFKGGDKLDCKFYINPDGTVGFKLENYNPALPLIIDPLILFDFRQEN
jgi:hypothetical protein